jgi:hypothetical protein
MPKLDSSILCELESLASTIYCVAGGRDRFDRKLLSTMQIMSPTGLG